MSSEDIVISVRGLGKAYTIVHDRDKHATLGEAIMRRLRHPMRRREKETFWALRDVSFDVNHGEVVGIIGRNGAGKSTMLKILSRITEPTTGEIDLYGRVGSLLEVGTGFHRELTGRENIYLNGAILGMRRREIDQQFDAILDFAGTEKFLDTPVKRYSSGMYVRLAFAVAAHLNPEILIVDEVLSVGDAEFQKKCLGKMSDVARGGRTVLFVSHNLGAVRTLTQKCIYLHQGEVARTGSTAEVVDQYVHDSLQRARHDVSDLSFFRREGNPDAAARFTAIRVDGKTGSALVPLRRNIGLELELEAFRRIEGANVTLTIRNAAGEVITTILMRDYGNAADLEKGLNVIRCQIDDLHLMPGEYTLDAGISAQVGNKAWDVIRDFPAMEIVNAGEGALAFRQDRPGMVLCPNATWSVESPRLMTHAASGADNG